MHAHHTRDEDMPRKQDFRAHFYSRVLPGMASLPPEGWSGSLAPHSPTATPLIPPRDEEWHDPRAHLLGSSINEATRLLSQGRREEVDPKLANVVDRIVEQDVAVDNTDAGVASEKYGTITNRFYSLLTHTTHTLLHLHPHTHPL